MIKNKRELPPISIPEEDKIRLRNLAYSAVEHLPDVAEDLLQEIERAESRLDPNVVRMGSTVEFETDAGMRHKIKLVFPEEADISAGRISVLTPIGTALLGLIRGQQMTFSDREGRKRQLRILAVSD
jgi:regulator of nucleoside diphosphate kinase